MTGDRKPDHRWLTRLVPHRWRETSDTPPADPFIPTSAAPLEQVRKRLESGAWEAGSDVGPRNQTASSPAGTSAAWPANQRRYPT